MEAGQAALNAIGSFRAAYADSLKLTEGALKDPQAILFRNIKSSMDVIINQGINGQTDKLQATAETLASAIGNIPFSSDVPRVTRVGPLYSVEEAGLAKEVVIRGIGLSNGSPILEVGGKNISPNTKTDTEIRFPLPPHGAVTNKPLLFSATLHLFERKGWIWHDYILRTYPIRLAIYPREIGQFTTTPRRRVPKVDTNNVPTPPYRCESPHGEGSFSVPVSVVPTPGWTIVVSSIKYNSSFSNHGSFTMGTTAATGFTGTLSCYGFGIVKEPITGTVLDHGSVGVEQGTFSYTETRESTTLENGTTKLPRALLWGDSLTISDLPADTETILFELKPFTGETLDLEGAGSNRFMRLEYNAASKVATVTALGIEQALRQ